MMSKPAKRLAKQLVPPSLDDDPVERKRQLNVLAQRRYRRRKREHLQQLEKSAAHRDSTHADEIQSDTVLSSASKSINCKTSFDDFSAQDFEGLETVGMVWYEQGIDDNDVFEPDCFNAANLNRYDASLTFPLTPVSSGPTISSSVTPASSMSSSISRSSKPAMSRDELHLPLLQLNLLRGLMTVAKRLKVEHMVFDLHANSPFCLPNDTAFSEYLQLPSNLRPTAVQLSTPHHPALDLLPWPDVRDKLIMVFSQPIEVRPPSARSPTAFVEFVYDLEDSAEGVRIWGDDPAAEDGWEVGEKLFDNWWWALTGKVVLQANVWREMRGARLLGGCAAAR